MEKLVQQIAKLVREGEISMTTLQRLARNAPESSPARDDGAAADVQGPDRVGWDRTAEDLGLDPGIARVVMTLREHGIETMQSCEGGEGHAYAEPTVEFGGGYGDGWKALGIAFNYGFPVGTLMREWRIDWETREPVGPYWVMVFSTVRLRAQQRTYHEQQERRNQLTTHPSSTHPS